MVAHGWELAHAGWVEERCALKIACAYQIGRATLRIRNRVRMHRTPNILPKPCALCAHLASRLTIPCACPVSRAAGKKHAHCAARAATRAPAEPSRQRAGKPCALRNDSEHHASELFESSAGLGDQPGPHPCSKLMNV